MSNLTKMMKSMAVVALLVVASLTTPTMALAHQGEDHGAGTGETAPLKGTVDSFADDKLVVRGNDGKVTNVHVDTTKVGGAGYMKRITVGAEYAFSPGFVESSSSSKFASAFLLSDVVD